jgi:hypothetical protein
MGVRPGFQVFRRNEQQTNEQETIYMSIYTRQGRGEPTNAKTHKKSL